ncbi:MAG: hypothetical protein ACMG6E_01990, partial [Candidatus Roizmanbacteria bacterium]
MIGFDKIFSKKPKDKEYYLGLVLQEKAGVALLLEIHHSTKTVVPVHQIPFQFTNHWDTIVEDIDEALYRLEEYSKTKVDKVLYFLYSHLVDLNTKHIKAPYLEKLKIVSQELGLEPLGYLEHHEALSEYLSGPNKQDFQAIIIESDSSVLTCFIYKNGEPIFTESTVKTHDPLLDIQSVLDKVAKLYTLPSRIILYSALSYDEIIQKLPEYAWPEHFFIEKPTVEVIAQSQLQQAMIAGVQKQLFDVAVMPAVTVPVDMYPPDEFGSKSPTEAVVEEKPLEEQKVPDLTENVVQEDMEATSQYEPQESHDNTAVEPVFGFAVGGSLSQNSGNQSDEMSMPSREMRTPMDQQENQVPSSKKFHLPRFPKFVMPFTVSPKLKHVVIPLLGGIVLASTIFSLLFYFHKATVVITQKSKN